jgi:hypothetical protein
MSRKTLMLLASFVFAWGSPLKAQKIDFNWRWDEETVKEARTAEDAYFLNEDEKKVIMYANLARADGSLFASTFLDEYIRIKKLKPDSYIRSLYDELEQVRDLPMLLPERDLYKVARDHASWSGKKGYEGHKGFKQRFAPMMKKYVEVGHRKNLLNPRFNSIGVAIKPHKRYEYNCVMGFGLLPRTYLDYVE